MVVVVWDDVLNISVGKVVESRSLAFGRFAVYSRLTSRDADMVDVGSVLAEGA